MTMTLIDAENLAAETRRHRPPHASKSVFAEDLATWREWCHTAGWLADWLASFCIDGFDRDRWLVWAGRDVDASSGCDAR